jgi:transcriptional regulatory protein RtcR
MKNVLIGLLGSRQNSREYPYRPTLALCQQPDLKIDRLELLYQPHYKNIAAQLIDDMLIYSPEIAVRLHEIDFGDDPWDFETVYAALLDFARGYEFDIDNEKYFVHVNIGTHVARICLFLLSEAHYLPGELIQSIPPDDGLNSKIGGYKTIDLDLSKYDRIAMRFSKEQKEGADFLKDGIKTSNREFNEMIDEIEKIAIRSKHPILLAGATGSGKSKLAKRIFDLKRQRNQVTGEFVPVNCATLRGDTAMSSLFGHIKGAFTGAADKREGFLKRADKGLLFLDEIGELGLEEQSMLLKAIEEKSFTPLGADKEIQSQFQLIAGTNRNLLQQVKNGSFRDDLLARIDLWSFELPSLKQRLEDLDVNIDFELDKYSQANKTLTKFNKQARDIYLGFAKAPETLWKNNFRDLNASITRMATLADGGRITVEIAEKEIVRLHKKWLPENPQNTSTIEDLLDEPNNFDLFDRLQLASVSNICKKSKSAADAGRRLFDVSRLEKSKPNDSKRLIDFLAKFDLKFEQVKDWHGD